MAYNGSRAYTESNDFSGGSRRSYSDDKKELQSIQKEIIRLTKELEENNNLSKEERADKTKSLERYKSLEKELQKNTKTIEKAADVVNKTIGKFNSSLDSMMTKFLQNQESMAYNLNGTAITLSDVTSDLTAAISGTGIVSQEKVYNNLSKLVQAGIVNNAEQRAYLQTLSEDLGMIFNAQDGSLTRLIRLQQSDLSSHRMAIEASLKEFLNSQFQTSEYMKHFTEVSSSLLEAQSLMTASSGMALESTVQKWIGALSSAGISDSTVSSLSQALGYLGSGNLAQLSGSPMLSLLTMGASRSGLSIGNLFNTGLTADITDSLMRGVISYLGELGGSSSNVVKSEYARIFGLGGVSDLRAINNISSTLLDGIDNTQIGTDISDLLEKTDRYVYATQKISNYLENLVYGTATNIASNQAYYTVWKGVGLLSSIAQEVTGGDSLVKGITNVAQTLVALPSLAKTLKSAWKNGAYTGPQSVGDMVVFEDGTISTDPNLVSFYAQQEQEWYAANGGLGAMGIYNRLGRRGFKQINGNFAGSVFGFSNESGFSNSGSGYSGDSLGSNTSASTSSSVQIVDMVESKTVDDVYNRLSDVVAAIVDLPNQPFGTVTRIAEAGNTVSIGQDSELMQDMVTYMAMNVQNIYSLLVARFTGSSEPANVVDTTSMNWNHPFDWMYTTVGGNA